MAPTTTDPGTVTITVAAENDPPVNNVPVEPLETDENTPRGVFMSVSDVDAGDNPIEVSLTATNGALTFVFGTTGLSFSQESQDAVTAASGFPRDIVIAWRLHCPGDTDVLIVAQRTA